MAKKKGKPKAKAEKGKGGRPTDYRDEFAPQVRKLFLLKSDATDTDIAEFFGKAESTINLWKKEHPEFMEAIRAGKTPADTEVADSLFRRACGAEWIEEIAFKVKNVEYKDGKKVRETEEVKVVPVKRAAPPDTLAASIWLQNRRPQSWRSKQDQIPPPPEMPVGEEYTLTPDEPVPNAPVL